jgi:hypothetical protein
MSPQTGSGRYWRGYKLNPRISIFIYCLFTSLLFWLLIVFSREYAVTRKVRALYVNIPNDKVLGYQLPDSLRLELSGAGFALWWLQVNHRPKSVVVDVSLLRRAGNKLQDEYLLPLNQQISNLNEQLSPLSVRATKVFPEQVLVSFDPKASKVVRVVPCIRYRLARQHQLRAPLSLLPNQLLIRGPAGVLQQTDSIETELLDLGELSRSRGGQIKVRLPKNRPQIDLPVKLVRYNISVEKFTEGEMLVPIRVVNLNPGYSLKPFPDKVKVTFLVGLESYRKLNPLQFQVEANATSIESASENARLPIRLTRWPSEVRNPRLSLSRVEYILKKNNP